jgi:hypothetical protein
MPSVTAPYRGNPLPHRRLRMLVFVGCAVIILAWARYHFTTVQVNNDPTSTPDLAAATETAQPLLEALDKYHAENGLYPTNLDELPSGQLPSLRGRGYMYSASGDWVYKSDACAAREKHLHGWIMKEVKEYQKQIDDFKHECVTGYRDYQLQSPDFPRDAQTQSIERWAYFDSQTKQWSLGWCSKIGKKAGEISTNGMCRWRLRGGSVRW